jgi:hypothetical protein
VHAVLERYGTQLLEASPELDPRGSRTAAELRQQDQPIQRSGAGLTGRLAPGTRRFATRIGHAGILPCLPLTRVA